MKKFLIPSIIVGVLLALYLGMSLFFSFHYYPDTKIGTVKCGLKTSSYAVDRNKQLGEDYMLSVTDRKGNKFTLTGKDFSYGYVPSGEEEKILKKQNGFAWPANVFKTHRYNISASATYDKAALAAKINELSLFNDDYIEDPVNADVKIENKNYEIIDEVPGNKPVADQITKEIETALDDAETSVTLSDDCYVRPEITKDSDVIKNCVSQIQNFMNSTIHYDIDGADENLTSEDIADMLTINDDFSVSLNDKRLTKYVQHLASTYNTYADVRAFKTSSGDVVNIGGGDYGWVISKAKETEQLKQDLAGGAPVEREPIYEQRAKQRTPDDIGNTYVEIDYTKQHLWFYKDGSLFLESDIVSGNLSADNGSVDGVFKIVYKQKDATLVGETYRSAVNYFMPFAYNIGLHDASWQTEFGGDRYKTAGSHGCINLPPDIAKTIFENIETGTPVIAYYREPVTLTNNAAKMSNAYSYVKPDDGTQAQ